jgi:uncharacterized SAM-dependent methyltransferase
MNIVVKPHGALVVKDADRAFFDDVLAGLLADPKRVPPKYFYDEVGSQLFQRITMLPEYYLTRTETGILERHAGEIAKLIPPNAAMIEFGAGSSAKTRILLGAPYFRVCAGRHIRRLSRRRDRTAPAGNAKPPGAAGGGGFHQAVSAS